MELEGYKVVGALSDGLFSGVVNFTTLYQPNVWTWSRPTFGPISVFDSPENAQTFIKVVNPPSPDLFEADTFCAFRCLYRPSQARRFWYWHRGERLEFDGPIPPGTLFANAVKLLELVT